MSRKKTHEEYVAEVAAINPNIEVVGTYVNNSTKIAHRCKIDDFEWEAVPSSILRGNGCPLCGGSMKKTHEQYVEELRLKNPSITVIDKYSGSHTKIKHKCLKCRHEWLLSPANALKGRGCPVCGGTMQKTHEQYVDELRLKNPSIIAIEKYVNHTTKIKHKCLSHDYEWETTPHRALEGCGCPMCRSDKLRSAFRRTHDEYVKYLAIVNKDIVVLEEYVNARTPIRHKCLVDGWEWDVLPDVLLHGHGCPQCNKRGKSLGEKIIAAWLDEINISYKPQETFDDCKDKYVLRFDFYLLDYNILIEYNGIQHYKPIDFFGGQEGFESTVRRDKIKEDYCKNNNILLIVIPYFADIYEELDKLYELIETQDAIREVAI